MTTSSYHTHSQNYIYFTCTVQFTVTTYTIFKMQYLGYGGFLGGGGGAVAATLKVLSGKCRWRGSRYCGTRTVEAVEGEPFFVLWLHRAPVNLHKGGLSRALLGRLNRLSPGRQKCFHVTLGKLMYYILNMPYLYSQPPVRGPSLSVDWSLSLKFHASVSDPIRMVIMNG